MSSAEFYDSIKVGNITIANIYKPPSASWPTQILPALPHPAIYVGDFNSHHTDWGYNDIDEDGEKLQLWAGVNSLELVYDAEQPKTFRSARWQTGSSPDLCLVTTENGNRLQASNTVLENFPHSGHRPSLIHIGLQIPTIIGIDKPR